MRYPELQSSRGKAVGQLCETGLDPEVEGDSCALEADRAEEHDILRLKGDEKEVDLEEERNSENLLCQCCLPGCLWMI